MWPFKKNKTKELEKKHNQVMEEARDLQRSGDLRAYAVKIMEAKELEEKLGYSGNKDWHP